MCKYHYKYSKFTLLKVSGCLKEFKWEFPFRCDVGLVDHASHIFLFGMTTDKSPLWCSSDSEQLQELRHMQRTESTAAKALIAAGADMATLCKEIDMRDLTIKVGIIILTRVARD